MTRALIFVTCIAALCSATVFAQTREEKVRADREKVEAAGFWIYNDLPKAFRQAKQTGKPILVVLRCIPCEECVKLDDELVDTDPVLRPLLEKFVCVRQVSTNGLDLSLFQYDTDQSFAVFMLNADGVIYGRFGTRSHRTEWFGDVSLPGMAKALQGALALHANYPANKDWLAGKRGEPLEFASPELYPSLKDQYTDSLDYEGNVVKSCIHCHQIGDARRDYYWHARKPIPEMMLFPYPHPKVVGLTMDPEEMATVNAVAENSPADAAGIRARDEIRIFGGQPMLSMADMQWVLHGVDPQGGEVPLQVKRGGERMELKLTLVPKWRREGDISWRVSAWGLRRMVTGGLKLEELSDEQRREAGIPAGQMALEVQHAGRYGPHAAARRAGVREGDILVAYGDRSDLTTPSALLTYGATHHKMGDRVQIAVMRGDDRKTFTLPIQK